MGENVFKIFISWKEAEEKVQVARHCLVSGGQYVFHSVNYFYIIVIKLPDRNNWWKKGGGSGSQFQRVLVHHTREGRAQSISSGAIQVCGSRPSHGDRPKPGSSGLGLGQAQPSERPGLRVGQAHLQRHNSGELTTSASRAPFAKGSIAHPDIYSLGLKCSEYQPVGDISASNHSDHLLLACPWHWYFAGER